MRKTQSTQSTLTIDMRKIIYALILLLLLSACGRREEKNQIADLKTINAALEEENAALKEENASLRAQLEELSESSDAEANPIDSFYKEVEVDGSTVSMNILANSWADAWETETRHLAEELKVQLPLQEDRDLVDGYISAVEEQAGRMDVMAIYPVSDISIPYPERINSSGTLRGVMWAGMRNVIWQDTFFQLLYVLPDGPNYTYIFDRDAAGTDMAEKLAW